MSEIAILVTSLHYLMEREVRFVFTDRHAYLQAAYFSNELKDLDRIAWDYLQRRDFQRDPDNPAKFERYQAEALIHQHLPVSALMGIACYNSTCEANLRAVAKASASDVKIRVFSNWYF
jgi:hypothetical protein